MSTKSSQTALLEGDLENSRCDGPGKMRRECEIASGDTTSMLAIPNNLTHTSEHTQSLKVDNMKASNPTFVQPEGSTDAVQISTFVQQLHDRVLHPLLTECSFEEFHPFIRDYIRILNNENDMRITCLRDLECLLLGRARMAKSEATYLRFCQKILHYVANTIPHLSLRRQIRENLPDKPYSEEYFIETTSQMERNAQGIAARDLDNFKTIEEVNPNVAKHSMVLEPVQSSDSDSHAGWEPFRRTSKISKISKISTNNYQERSNLEISHGLYQLSSCQKIPGGYRNAMIGDEEHSEALKRIEELEVKLHMLRDRVASFADHLLYEDEYWQGREREIVSIIGEHHCKYQKCAFRTVDVDDLYRHESKNVHYTLQARIIVPRRPLLQPVAFEQVDSMISGPGMAHKTYDRPMNQEADPLQLNADHSITLCSTQQQILNLNLAPISEPLARQPGDVIDRHIPLPETNNSHTWFCRCASCTLSPTPVVGLEPQKQRSHANFKNTIISRIQEKPVLTSPRDDHIVKRQKTTKEEVKYPCEKCPKSFTRTTTLREHARIHTNERPFKCGKCNKGFSRRKDMIRHEKLHAGKKMFICQWSANHSYGCGREFAREDALVAHLTSNGGLSCLTCFVVGCAQVILSNCKENSWNICSAASLAIDPDGFAGCGKQFETSIGFLKHFETQDARECFGPDIRKGIRGILHMRCAIKIYSNPYPEKSRRTPQSRDR